MPPRGYYGSGGYPPNPNVNININISPRRRHPANRPRITERDFYEMQAAALDNARAYERERRRRQEEQYQQQLRFQEEQQYQRCMENGRDAQTRWSRSSAVHGPPPPLVMNGQRRLPNSRSWPGVDIPSRSRDAALQREIIEHRMWEQMLGSGAVGMPSRAMSPVSQLEAQAERRMRAGGGMPGGTGSRRSQNGVRFDGHVRAHSHGTRGDGWR
ncbi:MAG: hypothetical protein L6R36_006981 [Xanthoria steineri]|nr:MAG: hypothetical protein L6R36_006981 [Xanthoria steineri]